VRKKPRQMDLPVRRLAAEDLSLMREMMNMFGVAFEDKASYGDHPPSDEYLRGFLARPDAISLAATSQGAVIGGLVAYVLQKFEQERSEIYIYDLAVEEAHRRAGVATTLIHDLRRIGAEIGAYVIFVQADLVDAPAIALYESLGTREDVLHFDIEV
jgi:aminoglycoside 3-N-acetyltransferase I